MELTPPVMPTLLLMDGHLDHSGEARAGSVTTWGVQVWASASQPAPWNPGDEAAIKPTAARRAGMYQKYFR